MKDVLIIKSEVRLPKDMIEQWHEKILKMKEEGVILLPYYLTPMVVPEDVAIQFVEEDTLRWQISDQN